jgi:hypothetical protein
MQYVWQRKVNSSQPTANLVRHDGFYWNSDRQTSSKRTYADYCKCPLSLRTVVTKPTGPHSTLRLLCYASCKSGSDSSNKTSLFLNHLSVSRMLNSRRKFLRRRLSHPTLTGRQKCFFVGLHRAVVRHRCHFSSRGNALTMCYVSHWRISVNQQH